MMEGFDKCKFAESCGYEICIPEFCDEYEAVKMTNADRIRAMNDDELRNFLCGLMNCGGCAFGSSSGCTLKDWLQMPSKEEQK